MLSIFAKLVRIWCELVLPVELKRVIVMESLLKYCKLSSFLCIEGQSTRFEDRNVSFQYWVNIETKGLGRNQEFWCFDSSHGCFFLGCLHVCKMCFSVAWRHHSSEARCPPIASWACMVRAAIQWLASPWGWRPRRSTNCVSDRFCALGMQAHGIWSAARRTNKSKGDCPWRVRIYINHRRKFRSLTFDNNYGQLKSRVEKSSQKKEVTGVRKSEERRYTGAKFEESREPLCFFNDSWFRMFEK